MGIKLEQKNNAIRYVEIPSVNREQKGKSLISDLSDYTVIDIETTGLDVDYNHIIEIAAIKVRNSIIVDSFSSLVKPVKWYYCNDDDFDADDYDYVPLSIFDGSYYVDEFITKLTGITNEMLEEAPESSDVLAKFSSFIGNDVLVGHNVNFDINFIYTAMMNEWGKPLTNNFIDTMRFSRKLFPKSAQHRLLDTASCCGVKYMDAHRSLNDCEITYRCFEKMKTLIAEQYSNFKDFATLFVPKSRKFDCSSILATTEDFDEDHPFYQKTVVFTGALSGITRKEAMQLVVNVGGNIADNVTKATNYLVIGSFDFSKSVKGNKSSKMKKAEKMKLDGLDIEVISEKTFLTIIENK